MFDLTGRKALVTGATGGLGEEIAKMLHKAGATVGLHGTRAEKLESLAAELGERVHVFPANLADRDAVKALGEKAEAELGGVDILVNNAGITKDGLFVRMSDNDWDQVMEINLASVFRLTRELTHPMMRRRFGRIINITSIVGVTGNPGQANYCASKAGMIGNRLAQHHRELHRPRIHRICHDREAERQAEGSDHGLHSDEAHGHRRRNCCRRPVPCIQ
jgi:3-oxoacyl-[acyl-carrier protein] reductase